MNTRNRKSPLPVKDGVAPNSLWLEPGNWCSMAEFFLDYFPHLEKQDVIDRFREQEVVTADGKILSADSPYKPGQHIYFYRKLKDEITVPFKEIVIYEDDNIVVADKPHFLPVAPSGQYLHETLVVRLRKKLGIDELEPCHRLDRETAGLVLLTKKASLRHAYQSLFAQRKIIKSYHALATTVDLIFPVSRKSRIETGEPFFRMRELNGKPNAETHINLVERRSNCSLYDVNPVTGRQHQIRVHMSALGMPIMNDPLYPKRHDKKPNDFSNPLKLHARTIRFNDPLSGKEMYFESTKAI